MNTSARLVPPSSPPKVSVRFSEAVSHGRDVYATYHVLSSEGREAWENVVRWSDLTRMLAVLERNHAAEMNAARASCKIPKIRKHTLRTPSLRVRAPFCVARAAAMEAALQALVRALNVRLSKRLGPQPLLDFLCEGDNVKSATPSENWFTVDEGWPPHVIARSSNTSSDALCSIGPMAVPREAVAPRCLTPTRREEPALYPPPSSTLGEVRVELLEARGLIAADTFSQNDVYGVMVCEGHAAVTVTLENMQHPRWQVHDARAARFPLHSVYSPLFVALLDADFGVIDSDEPLGRVVLDLRTLHPNTIYDCWLPLRMKSLSDDSRYGEVRLRYAVHWFSDQHRLLDYLKPPQPIVAPLANRADRYRAHFAAYGVREDEHYEWRVMQAHLDEIKKYSDCLARIPAAVLDLIFWRRPWRSLACCLAWQLWCSFLSITLSIPLMALLSALTSSYLASRTRPPLHLPPPALTLLRGILPSPLGRVRGVTISPASPAPPPAPNPAQPPAHVADPALPTPPTPPLSPRQGAGVHPTTQPSPAAAQLSRVDEGEEWGADASWECAASHLSARQNAVIQAGAARAGAIAGELTRGTEASSLVSATRLAADGLIPSLTAKQKRLPLREAIAKALEKRMADEQVKKKALAARTTRLAREASRKRSHGKSKWNRAAAATDAAVGAVHAASSLSLSDLNPLSPYLLLVQRHLGTALIYVRFAASVFHWEDTGLTGWLFGAVLLLALLLVVVINITPWRLLLRLVGVALLGPHMFFVGRKRRLELYEEAILERRYQAAGRSEAQEIFDHYYQLELAAVLKREGEIAAAEMSRTQQTSSEEAEREATRLELLRSAAFTETIPGMRSFYDKFHSLPELDQSSAVEATPLNAPSTPCPLEAHPANSRSEAHATSARVRLEMM